MKRTNPDSRESGEKQLASPWTSSSSSSPVPISTLHPLQCDTNHSPRSSVDSSSSKRNKKGSIDRQPSNELIIINKPKLVFNPTRTKTPVIVIDGLSSADRKSVRHPARSGATTANQLRPLLELKKLTITNLQNNQEQDRTAHNPQADDQQYQHRLRLLTESISAILATSSGNRSSSLTNLSNACQVLVSNGSQMCEALYQRTRDDLQKKAIWIKDDLSRGIPPDLLSISSDQPTSLTIDVVARFDASRAVDWLKKLKSLSKDWCDQVLMIRGVLVHLDRCILLRSNKMTPIWELGLQLFSSTVLGGHSTPISRSLSIAICQQITLLRTGQSIPNGLIKSLVQLILTTLGRSGFDQLVFRPLIQITDDFYSQEGQKWASDIHAGSSSVGGSNGYLKSIVNRIESEAEMVDRALSTSDPTLNKQTQKSITRLVHSHLIFEQIDTLLNKGLLVLLETFPDPDSTESLQTLYELIVKDDKILTQKFRSCFSNWMKVTGAGMVKKIGNNLEEEIKHDAGMVERLINFKSKMDQIVKLCFREEREMSHSIKEAFEQFINQRQNKPAELIAKFLDQKMRIGHRSMDENELEECLNQILVLFRYTQAKDIFEEFYKRDLSKRLLLSRSGLIDTERNMVMKLKEECGPGFTSKLETMFKDIETSNDLNTSYHSQNQASMERIDLTVSVLTAGSWPIGHTSEPQVIISSQLSNHLTEFEQFYHSKHLGRRLTWIHSLGQMVLVANFPSDNNNRVKKKELSVSVYQALILLLFNENRDESLGFQNIVEKTGIESKEVSRTLQSLACGKVRVLIKTPKGKEIDKNDRFSFNSGFKDDHFKIKINQIQAKETSKESQQTREKVVIERNTIIQLCIVRILKLRKRIKHSDLILEIIEQIGMKFKVEIKDIKLSIESLLNREYLERVEGTTDEYQYLA